MWRNLRKPRTRSPGAAFQADRVQYFVTAILGRRQQAASSSVEGEWGIICHRPPQERGWERVCGNLASEAQEKIKAVRPSELLFRGTIVNRINPKPIFLRRATRLRREKCEALGVCIFTWGPA